MFILTTRHERNGLHVAVAVMLGLNCARLSSSFSLSPSVTVISSYCIIIITTTTLIMHHFSLPLQTQNLPPVHRGRPTHLFRLTARFFIAISVLAHRFFLFCLSFFGFLFHSCNRLRWFNKPLNCTLNLSTFISFPFLISASADFSADQAVSVLLISVFWCFIAFSGFFWCAFRVFLFSAVLVLFSSASFQSKREAAIFSMNYS